MHGTCGLINPWHHLRKMSSWVGNSGRPPYVIPRGSAGLKNIAVIGDNNNKGTMQQNSVSDLPTLFMPMFNVTLNMFYIIFVQSISKSV